MTTASERLRGLRRLLVVAATSTALLVVAFANPATTLGITADPEDTAAITDTVPTSEPDPVTAPVTEVTGVPAPSASSVDSTAPVDDESVPTVTVIAVVAALGVLALAMWWMLRRTGDEQQPSNSDWPDRSDVI